MLHAPATNDEAYPQPPEKGLRSESDERTSGVSDTAEGGRLLGGASCSDPGNSTLCVGSLESGIRVKPKAR